MAGKKNDITVFLNLSGLILIVSFFFAVGNPYLKDKECTSFYKKNINLNELSKKNQKKCMKIYASLKLKNNK